MCVLCEHTSSCWQTMLMLAAGFAVNPHLHLVLSVIWLYLIFFYDFSFSTDLVPTLLTMPLPRRSSVVGTLASDNKRTQFLISPAHNLCIFHVMLCINLLLLILSSWREKATIFFSAQRLSFFRFLLLYSIFLLLCSHSERCLRVYVYTLHRWLLIHSMHMYKAGSSSSSFFSYFLACFLSFTFGCCLLPSFRFWYA